MVPLLHHRIKARVKDFLIASLIALFIKLCIVFSYGSGTLPEVAEYNKAEEVAKLIAGGECPSETVKKTTNLKGEPLPGRDFRCEPSGSQCPQGMTPVFGAVPVPISEESVKKGLEKLAKPGAKPLSSAAPPPPALVYHSSLIERCVPYSDSYIQSLKSSMQRANEAYWNSRPSAVNAIDFVVSFVLGIYAAIALAVVGFFGYIMPWWMWVIVLIIALPFLPLGVFWAFLGVPLMTVRHYVTGMMAWDEFKARLRYSMRRLRRKSTPEQAGGDLGTASFCTPQQAHALMKANRRDAKGAVARLGKVGGVTFNWFTDKHVLVLASTRSGKGVSLIIPNLLSWPGGVFVLDPKGENARATARRRADFGQVAVLDPWGVSGLPAAGFNPLARLLLAGDSMPTEAAALAGALVVGEDDHWNNSARLLLRGLILHVLTDPSFVGMRDLVTVRTLLMCAVPDDLFKAMQNNPAAGGLVAECGSASATTPERELGSILSTARQQTMFLDDPSLRASLKDRGTGGVDFEEWRRAGLSVFVSLPAPYMQTFNRWLRIVVTAALNTLTTRLDPPERPVQFHLDELATLGRLEAVETANGLAAGYGVQLWSVFQDLGQIRDLYKARASSFWSNAGARAVFSLQDNETAQYVSERTGVTTIHSRTEQQTAYGQMTGQSASPVARPLLRPDEVMLRYTADRMLVLIDGAAPLEAERVPYYQDRELAGSWDDPREPPGPEVKAVCLR